MHACSSLFFLSVPLSLVNVVLFWMGNEQKYGLNCYPVFTGVVEKLLRKHNRNTVHLPIFHDANKPDCRRVGSQSCRKTTSRVHPLGNAQVHKQNYSPLSWFLGGCCPNCSIVPRTSATLIGKVKVLPGLVLFAAKLACCGH